MEFQIYRNFPLPFRRRRTKTVSLEVGLCAVILVLGVCDGQIPSGHEVGGDILRLPTSSKSFPPSATVISTNFAALKNNTFRIASGKKFGKYFLSKKLTTTAQGFLNLVNGTESTMLPSTTPTGTSPLTDTTHSESTTTQTSTSTTRKPTTSRPTTTRPTTTRQSTTTTSSTTPGYEFITPETPIIAGVADFTSNGDILKINPKHTISPSSANQSALFDNFFEVLPVPSGFEGNGVDKFQDLFTQNNLFQSDQQLSPSQQSEAALAMYPDPDNLAHVNQDLKDLNVPDQIAMGSFSNVAVVAPPAGRKSGKSKMTRRYQQIVGANFPQNFQKFGVKDSLFFNPNAGAPGQVPTTSGKTNRFRNGRRHPSGFPGTPPSQSQAKNYKNVIGGINTRLTVKPTPTQAFGFPKGGLHEINPYTGTTTSPRSQGQRQSSHTLRPNPMPNIQPFSPYNPSVKNQNPGGQHHSHSVSSVRSQGQKSYQGQTNYDSPQKSKSHHTPTTFRPSFLQTTSLPVNHPNSWQPSPPLYSRQNHNGRSNQLTGISNANLVHSGSSEVENIVHPGNFNPHPTTPPPASHSSSHLQASESFLSSFLTGGMPKLLAHAQQQYHRPTVHPAQGFQQIGQNQPTKQGNGFRQYAPSSAVSGPDAGHSHTPTGPNRYQGATGAVPSHAPTGPNRYQGATGAVPSHAPTGPNRYQGTTHPPRNQFQGVAQAPQNNLRGPISLPQDHFPGPPPTELKLGPPPLNEFNIMPVPKAQPTYSPQHKQQQQANTNTPRHHPQHTPNSQASHYNTNQFAFHGSNIPHSAAHKPHGQQESSDDGSFANFPTPSPSQQLGGPGFQPFPQQQNPQNQPFNVGSPETPWIPKTKGRSHPHRHHHYSQNSHSSAGFDEFSNDLDTHRPTSSPLTVRPGLAGLSNDNTPALLGLHQIQELDEFTGEIDKHDVNPAQSHLIVEHGGTRRPAGFYELPSPPNLLKGRPEPDSLGAEEQGADSPHDADVDPAINSGSNSAEGTDGASLQQDQADVTVFNDISGDPSADHEENQNQVLGENDGESHSFQSQSSPAPDGETRYRRKKQRNGQGFKENFGGFNVDPSQTPYPQAQPQPQDQSDQSYQELEGYSQEEQMEHGQPQDPPHPYNANGFQDFGNFPGQSATQAFDQNEVDDQSSNEGGIGEYTPTYEYQGNDEQYNAAPHFQTDTPLLDDFQDAEGYTSDEVSQSLEEQVPVVGSSRFRGQGYDDFKQDAYPNQEHHSKHHKQQQQHHQHHHHNHHQQNNHQHHHKQHHQHNQQHHQHNHHQQNNHQQYHRQHQSPQGTSGSPPIPGPEFNSGLKGFGIGPLTALRPLQSPNIGGIGQSKPVANGHLVLGVPQSSKAAPPTGSSVLRGSLGAGSSGVKFKGPKDHSPHHHSENHHKDPEHSPNSGLFNFGGILGPLKGLGLVKGYLDSHNHGVEHDVGLGQSLGDKHKFKFQLPGKHEFNFGKTANAFDFEKDKLKIMKPNFNFGNEGFSYGPNKFNFGKEAQKFGKDPFGKNPYVDDQVEVNHPVALKHNLKYPVGKVVKAIISIGHKILDFYAKFAIPKDHYLRVASFAGIYLLFAWLLKDNEHLLYPKCEQWGWNGPEHHSYHAPAYYVPAMPVDPHLQQEFLDLFRGVEGCLDHELEKDKKKKKKKKDKKKKKKDNDRDGNGNGNGNNNNKKKNGDSSEERDDDDVEDDEGGDSMEAEYQDELGFINEMCARDRFFFGMSPYHVEAWAALARIFVEQKTPADVLHLARSLLHNHNVNPKVWYYALSAAAGQRPDMLGLRMAPPIDAIPDLFIPGHLIERDMRRYRGLPDLPGHPRQKRSASAFLASLKKSLNGTIFRGSVRDRYQRFIASLNATAYSTGLGLHSTARTTTSRTTTTSLPPFTLTTAAAVMLERIDTLSANETEIIDKLPQKGSQLTQRKGDESVEGSGSGENLGYDKNGKKIRKHPLGHGFGYIGDGFGKYKGSGFGGSGYGGDVRNSVEGLTSTSFEIGGTRDNNEGSVGGLGEYLSESRETNYEPEPEDAGEYSGKNRDNGFRLGGSGAFTGGNALGGFPGSGNKKVSAFPTRQGNNRNPQDRLKVKKHNNKGKGKKKKKKKDKKKKCIIVDGSVGLDNGIENKLWYFREDIMMNQHHWFWHQAYPTNASLGPNTDRRSELFFFMHRHMIARYNAERLSNGFDRTHELDIRPGALIPEGFDSHLKDFNSGAWWTPRAPNTPLLDILHMNDPDHVRDIIINDVFNLYNRFVRGIKLGKLIASNGQLVPIRFGNGFEALSSTVEASNLSVNPFIYDQNGFHNAGHMMVGLSTDPDYSKRLPGGVMTDAGVSMRDPTFYTLHTMLDNLFDKYKKTLPPYRQYGGAWQLQWHGVDITDVKIHMQGLGEPNELATFFIKHKFQLEPGVDRSIAKGIEKADICAVHLDHAPFQYQITIDRKKCAKSKSGLGTVRIFIAPRFNEHGDRLPLLEQRRLMIEMDVFQVELKVGRNTITRNSRDSALTRPWTRSLRDYEKNPIGDSGAADYCGCGWPHHLLIPKGNTKGMAFDLFVMVTNFDEDFVANEPVDLEFPEPCTSAYIFCGRPRRRYPDARPMGYPFDRLPYHVPAKACYSYGHSMKDLLCKLTGKLFTRHAATLEEYVSGVTNMGMTIFEIKHIPKVIGKHVG